MSTTEQLPDGVRLRLRIIPRARQTGWGPLHDGHLTIRLTAPPADGKANEALRRFLADEFGVPLSSVVIEHGATSRRKTVKITRPARLPVALE
jgi:uncharacterized protein (TIGR00251 family)